MYEDFTQNRIAQLRTQKGVSARDMSLSLGQNASYINRIENKRALPSLPVLFWICEYFQLTPQQFFDEKTTYPAKLTKLTEELRRLDEDSLDIILRLAEKLNKGKAGQ